MIEMNLFLFRLLNEAKILTLEYYNVFFFFFVYKCYIEVQLCPKTKMLSTMSKRNRKKGVYLQPSFGDNNIIQLHF